MPQSTDTSPRCKKCKCFLDEDRLLVGAMDCSKCENTSTFKRCPSCSPEYECEEKGCYQEEEQQRIDEIGDY